MKKFRVMLEGSNVALMTRRWFRRRRGNFGFYTVRYVEAEDEVSAKDVAIALVRAELKEQGLSAFQGEAVVVRSDRVEELASFGDAPAPGRGFSFFPEGT